MRFGEEAEKDGLRGLTKHLSETKCDAPSLFAFPTSGPHPTFSRAWGSSLKKSKTGFLEEVTC